MRSFHLFKKNFESKNSNYQQIIFQFYHFYHFHDQKLKIQNYTCVQFSSMSLRKKHIPQDNFALKHVFFPLRTTFIINFACCHFNCLMKNVLFDKIHYNKQRKFSSILKFDSIYYCMI